MEDLETQQYLLDLQGYLVVENVLTADEVATLNELFDRQKLPPPGKTQRFGSAPDGPGFLQWGKPFCDLLDHPQIMSILRFRLGDCFRLDRLYGMYMKAGMGRGRLHADYGAMSPISGSVPGTYFNFPKHEITDGFMVVAWSLTDAGPDHGGFCCIPGSHKSNYRLPQKIFDAPEEIAPYNHSTRTRWLRHFIHRSSNARNIGLVQQARTPLSPLQILRRAHSLASQSRTTADQHRTDTAPADTLQRASRTPSPLSIAL